MIQTQPVVGGTYDWLLNAAINTETAPGVFGVWDLTAATVTISFVPPSGPGQHFSASVLNGPAGTAHYTNLATLFNAAGVWGISWKVSNAGVTLESVIVNFTVYPSGAAT